MHMPLCCLLNHRYPLLLGYIPVVGCTLPQQQQQQQKMPKIQAEEQSLSRVLQLMLLLNPERLGVHLLDPSVFL
jgi:hypothetical protein